MNFSPIHTLSNILRTGACAALLVLCPLLAARAADAVEKATTNFPSADSPLARAETQAAAAAAKAAQSAEQAASDHTTTINDSQGKHGIIIDTDDDDDTGTPRKHHKVVINEDGKSSSFDIEDLVIPMFGITASFGTPVLIVFFICYFRYRRRKDHLATVREYLNRGVPVPPQLLEEYQSGSSWSPTVGATPNRADGDLRRGFRLAFIGLAITLAFFFAFSGRMWAWGLIPLVIGLGFIVSAYAEKRQFGNFPPASTGFTPPPPPPQSPPSGSGPFV